MPYELPKLSYAVDALEPHIDAETMMIHREKHHNTYLTNLKALESFDQSKTIEELLKSDLSAGMQNHGGGFYNHSIFWKMMSPNGGGQPTGELMKAIEKYFGTFEDFQKAFSDAAVMQFGSGWAWLVRKGETLEVIQRPNQNHPLDDGAVPILGVDVWEHAYYLKYQNLRPNYVKAFFKVACWDFASEQFKK